MFRTKRFLGMAAVAVAGALMTGCSSDENVTGGPQEPAQSGRIVTLTTTVGLDATGASGDATFGATRALTSEGAKTFAVGETMAIVYNNGSGTVKALSRALTVDDIGGGGSSARFTFDLETPDRSVAVTYIYPGSMAADDGSVNYGALSSQNGTLATLGSSLDLCMLTSSWKDDKLPGGMLMNQLAILALTLKDYDGGGSITSGLTEVTVTEGSNTYTVRPASGTFDSDDIYVAIRPTASADITVSATDGNSLYTYTKSLTNKTYAANNLYPLGWRMARRVDLSHASGAVTLVNGDVVTGTLAANYKVSVADGATVTLDGVTINGVNDNSCRWAGITCVGDATVILKDGTANSVRGFYVYYPGIFVPEGKLLTIQGTGSLTASGSAQGAGIGGGNNIPCGAITIMGGTITATGGLDSAGIGSGGGATCGAITIMGGTIEATGGRNAAGIGSVVYGTCGDITITGGTITATGGLRSAGIGSSTDGSSCGDISITGGIITAQGGQNGAGIGTGTRVSDNNGPSCGNITINLSSGHITATGGLNSAGIGTGEGTCGSISVDSSSDTYYIDADRNNGQKGDKCYDIGKGVNGKFSSGATVNVPVNVKTSGGNTYVSFYSTGNIIGYNHH